MDRSLRVVKRIAEEYQRSQTTPSRAIPQTVRERLNNRLLVSEPFATVRGAWHRRPDGGGVSGFLPLRWVLELLAYNYTPEGIVALAHEQISANGCELWEVHSVKGIEVNEVVEIDASTWLYPVAKLPRRVPDNVFFDQNGFPIASTALVQRIHFSPVVTDAPEIERDSGYIGTEEHEEQERQTKRRRLQLAILLATNAAVSFPKQYWMAPEPHLLEPRSSLSSRLDDLPVLATEQLPINETRRYIGLLNSFQNVSTLELAIDRLGRARISFDDLNRAIEVGMALEIALMHKEKSNAEITYKLSTRAAWLLGHDPVSRLRAFELAKAIYGERSSAVHAGQKKGKVDRREAVQFVRDTLVAILERGGFPEWDLLVLDAEELSHHKRPHVPAAPEKKAE